MKKSERCVSLLLFDFDGVLTDNRVWVSQDGTESVCCSRADGLGFDLLRAAGLRCAIISTETNPVVTQRAKKLRVPVVQGVSDKAQAVRTAAAEAGVDLRQVGFVGNDLNDLPALRVVGVRICPRDAAPEIRKLCDIMLRTNGGAGVVREIAVRLSSLFSPSRSKQTLK